MTIPEAWFSILLWGSLVVVASAATYLLVVLVREWRDGRLW